MAMASSCAAATTRPEGTDEVIWHWSNQTRRPKDDDEWLMSEEMNKYDFQNHYNYYHAHYQNIHGQREAMAESQAAAENKTEQSIRQETEDVDGCTENDDDDGHETPNDERMRNSGLDEHVLVVTADSDCLEEAGQAGFSHDEDAFIDLPPVDAESVFEPNSDQATTSEIDGGDDASVNVLSDVYGDFQVATYTEEDVSGVDSVGESIDYLEDCVKTKIYVSDAGDFISEQATDDKGGSAAKQLAPTGDKEGVTTTVPAEDTFPLTFEHSKSEETIGHTRDRPAGEPLDDDNVVHIDTTGDEATPNNSDLQPEEPDTLIDGAAVESRDENATDHDVPTIDSQSNVTFGPTGNLLDVATDDSSKFQNDESASTKMASDKSGDKQNRAHANSAEDVIDFDVIDTELDGFPEDELREQPSDDETIGQVGSSDDETAGKPDLKSWEHVYIDEDVMDFDIIQSDLDTSPEETKEQASSLGGSERASVLKEMIVNVGAEEKGVASVDDDTEHTQAFEPDALKRDLSDETVPKKGSIAEFMQKVSKKQPIELGGKIRPTTTASIQETSTSKDAAEEDRPSNNTETPNLLAEKETSMLDEQMVNDAPQSAGTWGVRKQSVPRKTSWPEYPTSVLASTIRMEEETSSDDKKDDSPVEADSVSNEVNAEDVEVDDVVSERILSDDVAADEEKPANEQPKSVNSEFVDGLDDIDKFFQCVDPPDELDVGAAGSSIQEVLMGQSTQILLKRMKLGLQFIKRRFAKVKLKVEDFASRRTTKDGEFALITRGDVKATVDKLARLGKRALKGIQDMIEDLFADHDGMDEDVFDMDVGFEQVRAKIDSLRGQNRAVERP